ncbi:hypothetical protein MFMK1_001352 [Metallumcola ferriviriculae]|uniref:Uncharacterized protein n=1 Tax=Metallumcola ferriviriculae TaxID=3039180 RepID=A0AAU0UMF0_9FIRM|nr:hypothetical protein MFMK1_001352 [Desulfitibacteraceae bacterium MK1]
MAKDERKRMIVQGIAPEELKPGVDEPVYTLNDGKAGPLSFDQNVSQLSPEKKEAFQKKQPGQKR